MENKLLKIFGISKTNFYHEELFYFFRPESYVEWNPEKTEKYKKLLFCIYSNNRPRFDNMVLGNNKYDLHSKEFYDLKQYKRGKNSMLFLLFP
jgi:hypothetical protein